MKWAGPWLQTMVAATRTAWHPWCVSRMPSRFYSVYTYTVYGMLRVLSHAHARAHTFEYTLFTPFTATATNYCSRTNRLCDGVYDANIVCDPLMQHHRRIRR